MHPVGSAWVSGHENVAQGNQASCQPCHGTDYRGTVLSRTFAARSLAGKAFAAGAQVGCYDCHNGPNP
jgi:nitrate/TMAO reductase-like tetraheme cytochrome c subunit